MRIHKGGKGERIEGNSHVKECTRKAKNIDDAGDETHRHAGSSIDGGDSETPIHSLSPPRARRSASNPTQTQAMTISSGCDKSLPNSPSGTSNSERSRREPEIEEENEKEEVLSIWPEGRDLVVERTTGGCGPCSDVEVEVLHGAATSETATSDPSLLAGGHGVTSSTKARHLRHDEKGGAGGKLRERVYARKCALQACVDEIKSDLAKKI